MILCVNMFMYSLCYIYRSHAIYVSASIKDFSVKDFQLKNVTNDNIFRSENTRDFSSLCELFLH